MKYDSFHFSPHHIFEVYKRVEKRLRPRFHSEVETADKTAKPAIKALNLQGAIPAISYDLCARVCPRLQASSKKPSFGSSKALAERRVHGALLKAALHTHELTHAPRSVTLIFDPLPKEVKI
jgi:hypothetical protein